MRCKSTNFFLEKQGKQRKIGVTRKLYKKHNVLRRQTQHVVLANAARCDRKRSTLRRRMQHASISQSPYRTGRRGQSGGPSV